MDLVDHQVDMLHIDCNDDLKVFADIAAIRTWCSLPIDLHIITAQPEKYFELLRSHPVEYLTFQHEDLNQKLNIPQDIKGKKGIAMTTPTPVSVFDQYSDFDFILIMATIPGQSGGIFDKTNFSKIRNFRKKYPLKSIHVDGGVNAEVSFILRNMGVTSSVSGSYLFTAPSIGHALMNLTKREIESAFHVSDFMVPVKECPFVNIENLNLRNVLQTVEEGNLGFCLVLDHLGELKGLISSADIRKALLKNLDNLNTLEATQMINANPVTVFEDNTVIEMLQKIKQLTFPVMYLPVINRGNKATGIVNFTNLIKGEL